MKDDASSLNQSNWIPRCSIICEVELAAEHSGQIYITSDLGEADMNSKWMKVW